MVFHTSSSGAWTSNSFSNSMEDLLWDGQTGGGEHRLVVCPGVHVGGNVAGHAHLGQLVGVAADRPWSPAYSGEQRRYGRAGHARLVGEHEDEHVAARVHYLERRDDR